MNIHVETLTPTARKAVDRRESFRASIAAKAAELADRKTRIKLAALPVAALETPLSHAPVVTVTASEVEIKLSGPDWFLVLADDVNPRGYPSINQIQKAVARHYNVTLADILSKRRTADIVLPRQVAFYLCKQLTPHSYPQIGRRFGGKDHTTALHSVQKIRRLLDSDPALAEVVSSLIGQLGALAA